MSDRPRGNLYVVQVNLDRSNQMKFARTCIAAFHENQRRYAYRYSFSADTPKGFASKQPPLQSACLMLSPTAIPALEDNDCTRSAGSL